MEHFKDCIVNAEHYALRDITRPITDHYRGEAWTTALAIVRERMAAAQKHAADMSVFPVNHDSRAYAEGRYHALRDCLDEMEEKGKP